jgi:hypothetical protein
MMLLAKGLTSSTVVVVSLEGGVVLFEDGGCSILHVVRGGSALGAVVAFGWKGLNLWVDGGVITLLEDI